MKEEYSRNYALEYNQIEIFGEINTALASEVISKLHYLDNKFKKENVPMKDRIITLLINSPGGIVTQGLAIYDTMNSISAKVATVAVGLAASMGAFLLAAGTKGMRSATENCEILIHQPLGGASGQASDIIIAAESIKKTRDNLNRMLAENTGKPIETIAKDTDRDNQMTALEAKKYGIIDTIVPRKKGAEK